MKVKDVKKNVQQILEDRPGTRSSDGELYYVYCERELGIYPMSVLRASDLLLFRKQLGLPTFEAVRRARQKVQAEFPELAAVGDVEAFRMVNEQEYKEFAKS